MIAIPRLKEKEMAIDHDFHLIIYRYIPAYIYLYFKM
jgi:hypothetical protein